MSMQSAMAGSQGITPGLQGGVAPGMQGLTPALSNMPGGSSVMELAGAAKKDADALNALKPPSYNSSLPQLQPMGAVDMGGGGGMPQLFGSQAFKQRNGFGV